MPLDLSPEILEEAERWSMRAKSLVKSARIGLHRSLRKGGGVEFAEHRVYRPGDDLRRVDWKASARSGRTVLKENLSDRRAEVVLLVDRSGSMSYRGTWAEMPSAVGRSGEAETGVGRGSRLRTNHEESRAQTSVFDQADSKWEAAGLLAMALSWAFLRQGDAVGLGLWGGKDGLRHFPIRGGRNWMPALAGQLMAEPPAGPGSLAESLAALDSVGLGSRPSLLVVVSDFLDPEEEAWFRLLAQHRARGTEVWLIHLVDPDERSFPFREPARFVDLEEGTSLPINPRDLANAYRREFEDFLKGCRDRSLNAGMRYLCLDLDAGLAEPLRAFVEG